MQNWRGRATATDRGPTDVPIASRNPYAREPLGQRDYLPRRSLDLGTAAEPLTALSTVAATPVMRARNVTHERSYVL